MKDGSLYRPVGVGCVRKGDDILVIDRYKESDELTYGMSTLPSGGVELEDKTFERCAIRETKEETDVDAICIENGKYDTLPLDGIVVKERENIVAAIDPSGNIVVYYTNSGKRYIERLVNLWPLPYTFPNEVENESRNPRYERFSEIISSGGDNFTPMSKIIFEVMQYEHGIPIARKNDLIIRDLRDVSNFVKIAV